MNFRKIISFSEYIILFVLVGLIIILPNKFFIIGIICIAFLALIELIYYSIEYFRFIKPKKIFLFHTRYYFFDTDSIIRLISIIILFIAFIFRSGKLNTDLEYQILFLAIVIVRSFLFDRFKEPIINSDILLFDNIFNTDILIKDIREVSFDSSTNNLILKLNNNNIKILRLKSDFIEKQNDKITQMVNKINNIA